MATSAKRKPAERHESLLDVLHQEHEEVKELLEAMLDSEDRKERKELFAKFKPAIIGHSHAEEEMFYPLLEEDESSRTDALESYVEHHIVERQIEELDKMAEKESDEWTAGCQVLKELVEHHIQEEEKKIFKEARRQLGKERLEELVEEFEAAKEASR